MSYRFILLVLILLTSACGFHLRGDNKLSPQFQVLQLSQSNDDDFNAILLQQLTTSGVTITDDVKTALLTVRVQILPEITLAKSSSSGLQIKQLKIRVEYAVKNSVGEWLIKEKQLEQIRDFESNTDLLLAKNNEKQQLYHQMKQNLVRILLYQLQLLK